MFGFSVKKSVSALSRSNPFLSYTVRNRCFTNNLLTIQTVNAYLEWAISKIALESVIKSQHSEVSRSSHMYERKHISYLMEFFDLSYNSKKQKKKK